MKRRAERLFYSCFNFVVSYLSMLSIRSKRIYVFGAWKGDKFSDNSKYLFLEAVKDKTVKAVWITKNKFVYDDLKAKGFKVAWYKSLEGIFYQLRASVYFTTVARGDVYKELMSNAVRVNLWHGVGLKKIMKDDFITKHRNNLSRIEKLKERIYNYPYSRNHYVITTSNTMTRIFESAFATSREFLLQLGQPRNDVFFDDGLETESFDLKSGNDKIVLYMPTHRNQGKKKMLLREILDLPALNRFCRDNNLIFLVKKHYYHRNEHEDLTDFDKIIDITQSDYNDPQLLLKYADILITDYSSCYVDYLLLDRPVIFYNYDFDSYLLNDRDLYFDYEKTTPGIKAKKYCELDRALRSLLIEGTDEFKKERESVKNIFYSKENQHKVGEKILKAVREIVEKKR